MDLNRFTQKAQQAVLDAQSLAGDYHHGEIAPDHLLLALLNQVDGVAPEIIAQIGARPAALTSELRQTLDVRPTVQ